jgi:hypothetical protein
VCERVYERVCEKCVERKKIAKAIRFIQEVGLKNVHTLAREKRDSSRNRTKWRENRLLTVSRKLHFDLSMLYLLRLDSSREVASVVHQGADESTVGDFGSCRIKESWRPWSQQSPDEQSSQHHEICREIQGICSNSTLGMGPMVGRKHLGH